MQSRKNLVLVFLIVLSVAIVSAMTTLHGQNQKESESLKQEDLSQYPIADPLAPEPTDAQTRAKRRKKGSRYDKQPNAAQLRVKENSTGVINNHWFGGMPALPATFSEAVVVGKVEDAQAFLSNDKTGIYSEFALRVEEILKEDGRSPITPGGTIIAGREGGRVKLSSGRLQRFKIAEQNMPRVGLRYVLFLRLNGDGEDYSILTGYELREGRVYPLDGEYATLPFEKYKGVDESSFINSVREAIATPSPEKGGTIR